jgi:hypothetical protein
MQGSPELSARERGLAPAGERQEAAERSAATTLAYRLVEIASRHEAGATTAEEHGLELRKLALELDTLSVAVRGRG